MILSEAIGLVASKPENESFDSSEEEEEIDVGNEEESDEEVKKNMHFEYLLMQADFTSDPRIVEQTWRGFVGFADLASMSFFRIEAPLR